MSSNRELIILLTRKGESFMQIQVNLSLVMLQMMVGELSLSKMKLEVDGETLSPKITSTTWNC
ncbi:hypothetical protein DPMN_055457 [Dreissena polymorpha]|uniref:Uncharacterized protein n=1 Tax=Dreissena polymorpha TaxID=45954 RepID=A0A9D4CSM3_DREPO|nr:hypothetical protein DPMN_055457 [Dreissena polymorpha]